MLYILIPVYNRLHDTVRILECLSRQSFKDFKVVVIDDGSSDGTGRVLQAKYPWVIKLEGDGNLWWTGAINKGVEYCLRTGKRADYVMTINNDVWFDQEFLEVAALPASSCRPSIPPLCVVNGRYEAAGADGKNSTP